MRRSLRLVATAAALVVAVAAANAVEAVKYASTPLGRMRSDCIHSVPNGATLRENAEGRLDVTDASGEYLRTLPKCLNQDVHPLLEAHVKHNKKKPRTLLTEEGALRKPTKGDDPPVFPPDYDGWTAYTAWNAPGGIDVFLGNFSVPDVPAAGTATGLGPLYIFTGLQNVDWIPVRDPNPDGFDIIQPVLQYPADGGEGWSIKSWYVTLDDGAINSDELLIQPYDVVFGNMSQTSATGWYIGSTVVSTGEVTVVNVDRPRLAGQFWAYNTLECYGCVDCSTYPKTPSKFSGLALYKDGKLLDPVWKLNPKDNPTKFCHETIDIIDVANQNINFQ